MERRYQDENFTVNLQGLRLQKLFGAENGGHWILFLKPENLPWQRFYIDAGLGFWGEFSETEIADELDVPDLVDLGTGFGVVGATILVAHCTPEPRIEVSLSVGSVVLQPETPEFDGKSQVRFFAR